MIKKTFYTTIENQVRNDGTRGLLYDHFEDYDAALAKLYTILAAAATSEIPYHAGYIIRDDGLITDGRAFDRRTEEPDIVIEDETNEELDG